MGVSPYRVEVEVKPVLESSGMAHAVDRRTGERVCTEQLTGRLTKPPGEDDWATWPGEKCALCRDGVTSATG
jgi:hypothetical protein